MKAKKIKKTPTTPKIRSYAPRQMSAMEEYHWALCFFYSRLTRIADKLILANTRFVYRMAHYYHRNHLDIQDLIQEGQVGLLMAIKKFDPRKKNRLLSYAVFWIRSSIQSYLLKTWSLVRIGTTQNQRKLFFRLQSYIDEYKQSKQNSDLNLAAIAEMCGLAEKDVYDVNLRIQQRDTFLGDDYNFSQINPEQQVHLGVWDSYKASIPEEEYEHKEYRMLLRNSIHLAFKHLDRSERQVFLWRYVHEKRKTLQEVGKIFNISRERARQIESKAIKKIRKLWQGNKEIL
jgi:RNA polymerase sigma-32 factor